MTDFYHREVESRRELGSSPFSRLALVRLTGVNEAAVTQTANQLADLRRRTVQRHPTWLPGCGSLVHRAAVAWPSSRGVVQLLG